MDEDGCSGSLCSRRYHAGCCYRVGTGDTSKGVTETVLYVGTDVDDGGACNKGGVGTVTRVNGNTVIDSVTVSEYNATLTEFRISADEKDNQTSTITTLTANDNSTITVDSSGWNSNKFQNLTIGTLVASNASIGVGEGQSLTLNKLTGTIKSAVVHGSLNLTGNVIGIRDFTLGTNATLGGIYNLGQTFSGNVSFTLLNSEELVSTAHAGGNNYERQLTSTMWNAEKITSATLTIGDYDNGGLVFYNMDTEKYYSSTSWSGGAVTYDDANIIDLDQNTAYIVAKVQESGSYDTITGLFAVVTVPEPTTATLSLLALAGLAMRRRRM